MLSGCCAASANNARAADVEKEDDEDMTSLPARKIRLHPVQAQDRRAKHTASPFGDWDIVFQVRRHGG
jgi:hypothetical protein